MKDREGYAVDDTGSLVYFVREAGGAGRVKIGITTSLRSRLATLQTGSPERLRVIHTEPGGRARELYFHRRWARHRVRRDGEWFVPAREILDYAASAPSGRPGRLRFAMSDVLWRRAVPRRRRRGYAARTLTGIAGRLAIAAVAGLVLWVGGETFAPEATETILSLILEGP